MLFCLHEWHRKSGVYWPCVNFHDYPEQEPGRQKPCVTRTEINKATLSSTRPELKLTNRGKFYTPKRYINPHISDVKIIFKCSFFVSHKKEGKIKQSVSYFILLSLFTWRHACRYEIVSEELVSQTNNPFSYGILCIFDVSIKAVEFNQRSWS